MGSILKEVSEAIRAAGVNGHVIADMDSESILSNLRERLGNAKAGGALWEALANKVSCHDPNAWRWISDYVRGRTCLLAIRPTLERAAFEFASGEDLVRVLGECSAFEFYVTDKEFSFLLCFNHHDYLIASGAAIDWLRSRIANLPASG